MKQMQEAMQQQMGQMQAAMQNQELQEKLKGLQDDPEFKDMFEDIQKNGMGALMKYMNDPQALQKLGSRMGDVNIAESAAATPTPPVMPEVNDLLDAARWVAHQQLALPTCMCCMSRKVTQRRTPRQCASLEA
jgi:hypothetical protein